MAVAVVVQVQQELPQPILKLVEVAKVFSAQSVAQRYFMAEAAVAVSTQLLV